MKKFFKSINWQRVWQFIWIEILTWLLVVGGLISLLLSIINSDKPLYYWGFILIAGVLFIGPALDQWRHNIKKTLKEKGKYHYAEEDVDL